MKIEFVSKSIEIEISQSLPKSIVQYKLISRDVESLDRIMGYYFSSKNRKKSEENEVIEFLFQYLEYHGPKGSVLFRHITDKKQKKIVMKRLQENYKGVFNINFINE